MNRPDREEILTRLRSEGFDVVGITAPDAVGDAGDGLKEYLRNGFHGQMDWMAARAHERSHPLNLWEDVRTIIVAGMNYGPPTDPLAKLSRQLRGNISVYVGGKDYHDVLKARLKRVARWIVETWGGDLKVFVDTAPVMEKPLAAASGIGWQGKHTNVVSSEFGSWLFLGCIFSTLELTVDEPHQNQCGSCQSCLDICPTQAFPAAYKLDARKCISYLTIEHKGHIPEGFRHVMGNRIYGCDDCLAICPWNKFAKRARNDAFHTRAELQAPLLTELVELDDQAFREVFAGSAVKRIGRDRFVRNVLIALGNSQEQSVIPNVEKSLDDASPLVRAMAVWALHQLADDEQFILLKQKHMPQETNEDVLLEWQAA